MRAPDTQSFALELLDGGRLSAELSDSAISPRCVRHRLARSSLAGRVLVCASRRCRRAPNRGGAGIRRARPADRDRQRALKERLERFSQRLSDAFRPGRPTCWRARAATAEDLWLSDPAASSARQPSATAGRAASGELQLAVERYADRARDGGARSARGGSRENPAPPATANRAAYEALAADYRKAVDRSRPIDSDVDYNWHWQKRIAADRPLFDRINAQLDAAVARRSQQAPVRRPPGTGRSCQRFRCGGLLRIEQVADHEWLFKVPVVTDIVDADIVRAFKAAVEDNWHVRAGRTNTACSSDDRRPHAGTTVLRAPDRTHPRVAGCAPPARGDHIDLDKHVARFPKVTAVLTTGAASLQLVAGRDAGAEPARRVAAHAGPRVRSHPRISDAYLRGIQGSRRRRFQVLELVAEPPPTSWRAPAPARCRPVTSKG